MTAAELRRWLSEEQFKLYCEAKEAIGIFMDSELSKDIIEALESLAECKRLMEKHEWKHSRACFYCIECGFQYIEPNKPEHAPACAWDARIAGYPREVKDAE